MYSTSPCFCSRCGRPPRAGDGARKSPLTGVRGPARRSRQRRTERKKEGSYGSFVMGLANVWPSYTSPLFASKETPLTALLTASEDSLLGSLPSLGAMIGTAIVGPIINKLGRKNGGIVISLFIVMSWVLMEFTTSPTIVLAARFLAGITGGGFLVYAPMFISEIADDSIRGALASGSVLFYCIGTLVSYLIGWLLTYRVIIWTNISLSVFGVFLIMFVTESPIYLLRQKKEEEAIASIAQYRGHSPSSKVVLDELSRLKQQINPAVELISITAEPQTKEEEAEKEKLNAENIEQDVQQKPSSIKLLFLSNVSRRAFFVVLAIISAQVFMGMVPVQVYAKTVFIQADPTRADLYTVLFSLTLMCGSAVTTTISDKAGRRVLIIASSVLVSIFMSVLGYLLQSKAAPPIVTVIVILVYCFSFMFGAGSVPYVLLAEVFVPDVQSLASMLIVEWVWFLNFFILAVFPIMNNLIGMHCVFYIFAAVGLFNAVTAYFILPETKGLSTEQIQEIFVKRK